VDHPSANTILSWWPAPSHARGAGAVASAPITAVILLGFIKGRMIIRYFMEVRTAPRGGSSYSPPRGSPLWAQILAIYLHEGALN
jgi:hypothetical protein